MFLKKRKLGPRLRGGIPQASLARPVFLFRANVLYKARNSKHAYVIEPAPDKLNPDRQTVGTVAPVDRSGGLLGHVVGHGERDVRQRVMRVIARRGKLGLVGKN